MREILRNNYESNIKKEDEYGKEDERNMKYEVWKGG